MTDPAADVLAIIRARDDRLARAAIHAARVKHLPGRPRLKPKNYHPDEAGPGVEAAVRAHEDAVSAL